MISSQHQQAFREFRARMLSSDTIRDIRDHCQDEQGVRQILGRLFDDYTSPLGLPSVNESEESCQSPAVDLLTVSRQPAITQSLPRVIPTAPSTGLSRPLLATPNHRQANFQAVARYMEDYADAQEYLPYPAQSLFEEGSSHIHEGSLRLVDPATSSSDLGHSMGSGMLSGFDMRTDNTSFSDYCSRSHDDIHSNNTLLLYPQQETRAMPQLQPYPRPGSNMGYTPRTLLSINNQDISPTYVGAGDFIKLHENAGAMQIEIGQTDSAQSLESLFGRDMTQKDSLKTLKYRPYSLFKSYPRPIRDLYHISNRHLC
ncbi:hypothetical protein F5Y07DRAFT_259447 [Xylaria sp. FL0933]|nr:hypothetical protein F5Y07DRAFT_259447 [Xylaria sp. FL0933]